MWNRRKWGDNPLDILPFGPRMRGEIFFLFYMPWILATGIQLIFLFLSVTSSMPRALVTLVWAQVILEPFVFGYVSQLQSIRLFENLFRRIPWDELSLTRIQSSEILDWIESTRSRAFRTGLTANLAAGCLPVAFLLQHYYSPTSVNDFLLPVANLLAMRLLVLPLVAGFSSQLGFTYLFRIDGYFRARLAGIGVALWRWLMLWMAFLLVAGVLTGMAAFAIGFPPGMENTLGFILLIYTSTVLPLVLTWHRESWRENAYEAFKGHWG